MGLCGMRRWPASPVPGPVALRVRVKFYGVPFYYLFLIYGYPKFIFGHPKMYFLDIHNSFLDIQKSIYGYPKIHFWISKNQLIIGYS